MKRSDYPPLHDMEERPLWVAKYGLPDEVEHGLGAYTNWGCRCEICKESLASSMRTSRKWRIEQTRLNGGIAPKEDHNLSTYVNWGCKCDDCLEAKRKDSERYYERKKRRAV